MKQRYRLEALLKLKARMKKRAEIALARSLKRLQEERKRLEEFRKELTQIIADWKNAREEMKSALSAGMVVGEGNVYVNYVRKLGEDQKEKEEEIEDQHEVIEEAEGKVAFARREYIDASRELQVMEKHRELWQKKMRGELKQIEAKNLNELENVIHQLKKWRGEKPIFEG